MATLNFTLRRNKQKANGEIPVFIRFTKNRDYKLMATGIAVHEKHWNQRDQRVRKGHRDHKLLNQELERLESEGKKALFELKATGVPTINQLKAAMKGGKDEDFYRYAANYIENIESWWTVKATKNAVRKLKSIYPTLTLAETTPDVLSEFVSYLRHDLGNSDNTISKNMECLKAIVRDAYDRELIDKNPFDKVKVVGRTKADKTRLSLEQIKAIEDVELEEESSLWHTRNYFLFAFYNAGIRFGDLAQLKWDNIKDGRLKYRMGKTSTWKNIKLLQPAWDILDIYRNVHQDQNYIFPILDSGMTGHQIYRRIGSRNAIANKDLKQIAKLAGIQSSVSFHVARHSFADYARSRGMSLYDISKALAHSDIKITQSYLKSFDEESLDQSMEELFTV